MKDIKKYITPIEIILIILIIIGIAVMFSFKTEEKKEPTPKDTSQETIGVISLSYVDGYKLQLHNVEYKDLEPGKEYKMKLAVTDSSTNKKLDYVTYTFTPKIPEGVLELAIYYDPKEFGGKTITFENTVAE